MNILLVEDNDETAAFIARGINEAGDNVTHVADGKQGVSNAIAQSYDVIIFDRMLPELDGLSAVRQIRSAGVDTPIIILTAMTGIDDRVAGLNAGADDYMVKPFAFEELYARLKAQTRRQTLDHAQTKLQVGELILDRTSHEAFREGIKLELLPREYKILEYLMQHENQLVTRNMLLENVWGYSFDPKTSLVQTHVSRLRTRLDKPFDYDMIKTSRGEGYILNDAK